MLNPNRPHNEIIRNTNTVHYRTVLGLTDDQSDSTRRGRKSKVLSEHLFSVSSHQVTIDTLTKISEFHINCRVM